MGRAEVIEKMFRLDDKPIHLYSYQKDWVNDESQFRIVNKSRQTGFSFVCACEALIKAMFVPRSLILFVSTGERGALRLMKYVHDLWYSIPEMVRENFPVDTESKKEFIFRHNGSQIISLPNNEYTVRGYPATDIYLDEFAFFEREDKMWEAILPSITRVDLKRRVSIISTPNGKLNNFFRIFEVLRGGVDDVWSRHLVPYTCCPDIDIGKIRKTLSVDEVEQEYCCRFIDQSTAVFTLELINSCVDSSLLPIYSGVKEGVILYAGVDFGKKNDNSVVSVFEKLGEDDEVSYIMRHLAIFPTSMSYVEQIDKMITLLKGLRVSNIWVDSTGPGEKLCEDLQRAGLLVSGVVFSRGWKEQAVSDVMLLMQAGRVKFFNNNELVNQFHGLRRKVTMLGNVRFEHDGVCHDDIFWSVVLALSRASHVGGFFGVTGRSCWVVK